MPKPRIDHGSTGCEAQMLPLCYAQFFERILVERLLVERELVERLDSWKENLWKERIRGKNSN